MCHFEYFQGVTASVLLFTILAEWRIMTNSAYAKKNNEDGLLHSIQWSNCCNPVAMALARVLMNGIHPPENIENGRSSGGWMPLISALVRTVNLIYFTLPGTIRLCHLAVKHRSLVYATCELWRQPSIYSMPVQALKYRSVTDIVRPIHEIVRRREVTTGHSVRPKWNWDLLFDQTVAL
jgi:hypothetical protein